MSKKERLENMYCEEYDKGARRPHTISRDKEYYLYWLVSYMTRYMLFGSSNVKVSIVSLHNDTYNITFKDASSGYRMKFYHVPRNLNEFLEPNLITI